MRARYIGDAEGVVVAFGVAFTHDGPVPVTGEFAERVKGNRFFIVEDEPEQPVSPPFVAVEPEGDAPSLSVIEPSETLEPLTQPAETEEVTDGTITDEEITTDPTPVEYVAKHRGRGTYSIMQGETEVREGLTKTDAEAFNAMSDEDKAAYVAASE